MLFLLLSKPFFLLRKQQLFLFDFFELLLLFLNFGCLADKLIGVDLYFLFLFLFFLFLRRFRVFTQNSFKLCSIDLILESCLYGLFYYVSWLCLFRIWVFYLNEVFDFGNLLHIRGSFWQVWACYSFHDLDFCLLDLRLLQRLIWHRLISTYLVDIIKVIPLTWLSVLFLDYLHWRWIVWLLLLLPAILLLIRWPNLLTRCAINSHVVVWLL